MPNLTIQYVAEPATQVVREAERRSLTVLVHQSKGDREHELAALDGFGSDFTDGLILSPLALTAQDIAGRTGALPTVLLGEYLEEGTDHVAIDNEPAAREATEHLLGSAAASWRSAGGTRRARTPPRPVRAASATRWRRRTRRATRRTCCRCPNTASATAWRRCGTS